MGFVHLKLKVLWNWDHTAGIIRHGQHCTLLLDFSETLLLFTGSICSDPGLLLGASAHPYLHLDYMYISFQVFLQLFCSCSNTNWYFLLHILIVQIQFVYFIVIECTRPIYELCAHESEEEEEERPVASFVEHSQLCALELLPHFILLHIFSICCIHAVLKLNCCWFSMLLFSIFHLLKIRYSVIWELESGRKW